MRFKELYLKEIDEPKTSASPDDIKRPSPVEIEKALKDEKDKNIKAIKKDIKKTRKISQELSDLANSLSKKENPKNDDLSIKVLALIRTINTSVNTGI